MLENKSSYLPSDRPAMCRAPLFIAHTNNKNMATPPVPLRRSSLTYFTACTPAKGRHQLHFLPNEREALSQQNLDRCNRRRNSRSIRWCALKVTSSPPRKGPLKFNFVKSPNDWAKPRRLFGTNSKWKGATRGARVAGAVLFDPPPPRGGGTSVRAYPGNTKSIWSRGACFCFCWRLAPNVQCPLPVISHSVSVFHYRHHLHLLTPMTHDV
jgi:hypothetical protein